MFYYIYSYSITTSLRNNYYPTKYLSMQPKKTTRHQLHIDRYLKLGTPVLFNLPIHQNFFVSILIILKQPRNNHIKKKEIRNNEYKKLLIC